MKLLTFKSKAAADVKMYDEHAKRILDLLGKDADRGIITAEEMEDAIRILEAEAAANREKTAGATNNTEEAGENEDADDEDIDQVAFSTRAYPLLEMMRSAKKTHADVMWGVL
jgi:hypothetical protein